VNSIDVFEASVRGSYFPYRISALEGRGDFNSTIATCRLPGCVISDCHASSGFAGRFVEGHRDGSYVLHFMVQGALQVEAKRQTSLIKSGEMVVFSDAELVRTRQLGSAHALALWVPARSFVLRAAAVDRAIHRPISFDSGILAVLYATLTSAMDQAATLDKERQAVLGRVITDLVNGLSLDQRCGADADVCTADANYVRLLDFVHAHLGDRELTIDFACARLGWSRSYITALCAMHETGFERTVIRLRLDRAQDLIRSSSGIKLSDVAERAGFANAAHFSRSFSKAFGVSPSTFRHRTFN
jgi:AraC-like DNA-binding protein